MAVKVCTACFSGLMNEVGKSTSGGAVATCNRCGSVAIVVEEPKEEEKPTGEKS